MLLMLSGVSLHGRDVGASTFAQWVWSRHPWRGKGEIGGRDRLLIAAGWATLLLSVCSAVVRGSGGSCDSCSSRGEGSRSFIARLWGPQRRWTGWIGALVKPAIEIHLDECRGVWRCPLRFRVGLGLKRRDKVVLGVGDQRDRRAVEGKQWVEDQRFKWRWSREPWPLRK